MADKSSPSGSYVIARPAAFQARMAKLVGDPRHQFYKAMSDYDNYTSYEAAVGETAVSIPGLVMDPITGRDEILYARRRGWVRDADRKENKSTSETSRTAFKFMTAKEVNQAVAKFDGLTRDVFLNKYGYGYAKEYFLNVGGRHYDSKAILGVATNFLPNIARPLRNNEFSGGEHQVEKLLVRLGFTVDRIPSGVPPENPFERGKVYNRKRDIHAKFRGQERGGIATPTAAPFIFLFTGQQGTVFGYQDGMQSDGSFEYTGEGQTGDMTFTKGNKAIRDHAKDGKDMLLFETFKTKGQCRYLGSFVCDGWVLRMAQDKAGALRKAIVFKLVPLENIEAATAEIGSRPPPTAPLAELRQRAIAATASNPSGTVGKGQRNIYARSRDVRDYVLARAKGNCEACTVPAPFKRANGTPYLEPHHTRRVSDGGPDHPRWVGAICPTCHRHIHYGAGGAKLNDELQKRLGELEGPIADG